MEYQTLLALAEDNRGNKKKRNHQFSLKIAAAKKTPKEKKLAENVKRFLEKQNEEEKQKKQMAMDKKKKLLELRKSNTKSTRTVNSMLNRTKSSNKAAIGEARNLTDTSTTLAGREQCDEDDYGYESHSANGFYEKLMSKYESGPKSDPMDKFTKSGNLRKKTDISKTIARVKNRLENGDDDVVSRQRNGERKHKKSVDKDDRDARYEPEEVDMKSKRKRDEALAKKRRLASAQKAAPPHSFNDLMLLAQTKSKEPVKAQPAKEVIKEAEFDRPMTKKEKEEYLREKASQLRKKGKLPPPSKPSTPPPGEQAKENSKPIVKKPEETPKPVPKKPVIVGPEFHPAVVQKKPKSDLGIRDKKPSTSSKRARSPSPVASRKRKRSPSPVLAKKKHSQRYNRIDSEEEYDDDSEMDDFIDDSDVRMDVSAEIRKMFGYDRRKFRDEDDFDDRSMENNKFSDLMKEEARSAKIGLMEDLEDMRREEEEKKRKKMMKKRRR